MTFYRCCTHCHHTAWDIPWDSHDIPCQVWFPFWGGGRCHEGSRAVVRVML